MPDFDIDPNFSVYGLVDRTRQDSAEMNHRITMTVISNEIENATLLDNADNIIFSGFQRMSRFLPQVERYRQIAQRAEAVYVFGVPDVTPPPIENITYVPLKENQQLFKEWFLVSYGQDYFSALATEELTHIDDPDPDRIFKGVWTFELDLVHILFEWLSATTDRRPEMLPEDGHNLKRQAELMNNSIGRMSLRVMNKEYNDTVRQELNTIVGHGVNPALKALRGQLGGAATTV